ncbi:Rieske 2Fe-2S domain-containing protein [Bdellovibrio sp. HCB337]|uniref:Rieske 2Fe-2S domain-containing protein n=1 Tax=Bdellovibrio sp. HCB337 TaxID=3394358 RepID=UPI0039A76DEF
MNQSLRDKDKDIVNHWYIVALDHEVPADRPIVRTVYDIPYVLFRNEEGKITVLIDKCPHRGSQLSKGTCEKGQLRCPYHGWKFDGQGSVCEIPSEGPDNSESLKRRQWKGFTVPTFQKDSCVWIWPGDPALATAEPPWNFPEFSNPKAAKYFMLTDFDNEVGPLVQNFMDVPHTVFVHSKWFRNRSFLKVPVKVDVKAATVKVTYEQPQDSIGFMESILNPKKEPMIHTDEYIFPNITRVDYKFGKYFFIINSQCTPVTRCKTRVYTWICFHIGPFTKLLKPFMQFYTRQVIEQDVEIMENHGHNLKVFGEFEYKSTPADELHLAIDKMRVSGAQDRHSPEKMEYSRERDFWI